VRSQNPSREVDQARSIRIIRTDDRCNPMLIQAAIQDLGRTPGHHGIDIPRVSLEELVVASNGLLGHPEGGAILLQGPVERIIHYVLLVSVCRSFLDDRPHRGQGR
jgi:hypothetical protein